ncbi:MAG: prolipoprotein diacylglyceryl transferase [Candidatus Shapirobacteria bacterium]|nr:prolipoprotein diacylglyceryl transferase [Candidatus Shapirobacteria bacterium]MDD5073752.1 prolipoprotein diacylglyceryl transferase [Candidatus Shapirobacteria bacterium]MDD5481647.1 prolipoprotein diacylglyceryl transferase [Candidatus Shapirobacteria bacterium]
MIINLINLPWIMGSITVFGLTMFLAFVWASFLFFRQTREEFANDEKIVSFLINTFLGWLIGARLFFYLGAMKQFSSPLKILLPWRYPGLSFTGGILGIIIAGWLWSKREQFEIWKLTDAATRPLLIFAGGFLLGQSLVTQELFYLASLGATALSAALSFWTLKSYRSLTWYPSGKIGFAFLSTNTILCLSFILLAFLLSSGLYLEKLLGVSLFLWSSTTLLLRSEAPLAKKINQRINQLTKNDQKN